MTDAEKRLWKALRSELDLPPGTHFRRQMAIGSFVVDFAALKLSLIVEVDGEVHQKAGQVEYDARRDAFLRGEGFRVMRFTNADVSLRLPFVLGSIAAAFGATFPSPDLSSRRGEER